MTDLFAQTRSCLEERNPQHKVSLTLAVAELFQQQPLPDHPPGPVTVIPGRPERPELVHFSRLPRRGLTTAEGRSAFIHALAHIEFNAINLAWDAVYRFPGMPEEYYRDWSRVAGEEALHFNLLCERLQQMDCRYGDFPAHNGLWEMAEKTAHDVLVRMALVPRVLEARGLDVTPGMLERLHALGDDRSVAILERILADEIGHVETGSRWFAYLCRSRNLEPVATFAQLLADYGINAFKKPLNSNARRQAGFDSVELKLLEQWAGEQT
jgi:uncharacterized ferritin-like protein (DUF455 family)